MNQGGLKVLMISGDRNITVPHSTVAARMVEYGALVEELHIVVMCDASHGLKEGQIGSNVWFYPTNSAAHFLRPFDAASRGKRIVFEKKFVRGQSLITADSIEGGWAGRKIKRKWRLPLEVQLHTNPFSPYYTGFQNRVRKFLAGGVFRAADTVRVVSEELKRELGALTSTQINVLPMCVDQEAIEAAPIRFDVRATYGWRFALLSVARLAPEKNISLALEALSIVRKQFPDTGLVLVGSGPEERRLTALAKKLHLGGAVQFAGWQTELGSFYKTANVFLQTSFFEGYGLALVEAGLSGLPVVTTAVGLAAELEDGKDAYIINDPHRADILAERIIDLLEHNQKRENLRLNLKHTLESKLLKKAEYLERMRAMWEQTARTIL